jgi:hypothetical protein
MYPNANLPDRHADVAPRPQFHEISSVSTDLSAKPPMALEINTEAPEVVVYGFARRK